jgi:hypothetical protein
LLMEVIKKLLFNSRKESASHISCFVEILRNCQMQNVCLVKVQFSNYNYLMWIWVNLVSNVISFILFIDMPFVLFSYSFIISSFSRWLSRSFLGILLFYVVNDFMWLLMIVKLDPIVIM